MRHKFFSKILIPVLLIILTIPTVSALLRSGYFPMHDDMQAMRLLQMDKCIKDGQIPCRWVPDMGFGYGYPQFNYYSPLPYYVMEVFHLAGFSYLDSVKAFFILIAFICVIGMYLLGSSLWGRWGGFLAAILYAYVPYRAVNFYVRGAVGELAAMAVIPFIFLFTKRLVEGKKNSVLGLSLSLTALLMSHNISSLIFIPLAVLWFVYLLINEVPKQTSLLAKRSKQLLTSYIFAFLISANFIVPALLEAKYVQIDSLLSGYFNYLAHFVGLQQMLFSNYWGYGASVHGPNDQTMLGVGMIYWLLPLVTLLFFIYLKRLKSARTFVFFLLLGWSGLFMMHPRSTIIWQNIYVLSYFQFPWRFLLLSTFAFSLSAGALVILFKRSKKSMYAVVGAITLVAILFSGNFFRPSEWQNITDEDKFSGDSWQLQQTVSIKDYLPVYAGDVPKGPATETPLIVEGSASLISGKKGTNWQKWEYEIKSDSAKVELPLFYFPGWNVKVNGQPIDIDYENDLGLMRVTVLSGSAEIEAKLTDTPVRATANILSIIGIFGLVVFTVKKKI